MHHELMPALIWGQLFFSFILWVFIMTRYHRDGIEIALGCFVGLAFLITDFLLGALVGDTGSISIFLKTGEQVLAAKRDELFSIFAVWAFYTIVICFVFRVLVFLKDRMSKQDRAKT